MRSQLLHLYGPIAINSYGVLIIIGFLIFYSFIRRDPRFSKLKLAPVFDHILLVSVIAGFVGGRLLYVIAEPEHIKSFFDIFCFWYGGFSILGTIITLAITLAWLIPSLGIPLIPFLDLIATYAPLLQSVSRIGCFCAGCCYGLPSQAAWAVWYSDPLSSAPHNVYLHPTQLYSAGILMIIFGITYFAARSGILKDGQLFCLYLFLQAVERFTVDFWRADRPFLPTIPFLSIYQLIALSIIVISTIGFIWFGQRKTRKV